VKSINLLILSKATTVPGQGVGAAYIEQVNLLKKSNLINLYYRPKKNIDVIHIHTINFQYYLMMLATHKPKIVYVHFLPSTLAGSIRLPKMFFSVLIWYVKKFYRLADQLVVVNPSFIDPLKKLGIASNHIKFIPNYVSDKDFSTNESFESIRRKVNFSRFTILGVGQVQTRKGILDFAEIARQLPQFDFVWVGGFSFKGLTDGYELLKEVVDHPPSNLRFTGIVPRESMKNYYQACDVFFLPSFEELMPMSVLEAAVMNKPILLRDLELYRPVFFDYFMHAKDVSSFIQVIQKLHDDASFYQHALFLTNQLKSQYQSDRILKLWEDYYQEVIKHGKTH
jgi:1,2-diacylglycerol-3-alpha-glucose alpha-1,2-galactosyltransferase